MFKTHSQTATVSAQEMVNQKLIMLVDDDPIFRKVTSAYLESQGFKVVEAENGLEALQQLRECHPDLVLCDLSMPVLDGIEFVRQVAELAELVQHHPHITIDYTTVRISLQTHDAGNIITEKDIEMAVAINKL